MKRHFYLLAAGLFTVCIANAQIKKGDVLLGGNIGFSSQDIKSTAPSVNNTNVNLTPSFGIAAKDNQLIGFSLAYGHSSSENPGYPKQQSDSYGAGFFVRRYKPLGSGFSLFAEGNITGYYSRQKNYNYTTGADAKGFSVNLGFYPGVAYAITPHIQLETGFQNLAYAQYGHTRITPSGGTGETKINNYNIGTGLSNTLGGFVVGLKWLLN